MIKKIFTLFKIGRKLALSDALNIVSKVYEIPILIQLNKLMPGLTRHTALQDDAPAVFIVSLEFHLCPITSVGN